ncbi:RNA-directed DNA polymerase (Reverse transcriptase) [Trifolium medium]|uniref:RNA-directed DNA polymerase (Reverse transcriptase) n=1 Tax=Trifolium medium TaxID=97028 RepID=A0A392M5Z0_9FABA|nr:RNA-directed DNA polymerase (Reverse transcriptase) [Trifolium medium]
MMGRMGFAEGWRQWNRACVFQSSMYVLVNGSPTEEFSVGGGQQSFFHGYTVSNNILFHTLQFADDTIIVGEANWDNLWIIKIVLRSFEIVSRLKVNFYKSKLYGINLDDSFLRASSSFLHCGVESIPFRFLRIPVRPRREASDKRRWISHVAGFFTVKTTYLALQNRSDAFEFEPNTAISEDGFHMLLAFSLSRQHIWLCRTGLMHSNSSPTRRKL